MEQPVKNETATTTGDPLLDVKGVAELAGVKPSTIKVYQNRSSYRRRHGTSREADLPEPDSRFSRVAVWHQSTILEWLARRPGPGITSDPL